MRALSVALALLGVCACGDVAPSSSTDGPVIAFGSDFQGFRGWESFSLGAGSPASGIHTAGPRTEYLKHRPPSGSREFPVGTIIVKELAGVTPDQHQVFAMVKRGGGYNTQGATNWEWFELTDAPDGSISILWRGVGPPIGEKYGGDAAGSCNSCHSGARDNDFVQSAALRLSGL